MTPDGTPKSGKLTGKFTERKPSIEVTTPQADSPSLLSVMLTSKIVIRLWVLSTLIVHYADLITDTIVTIQWYFSKDWTWAIFSTCFICLNPVIVGLILPTTHRVKNAVAHLFCAAPVLSAVTALVNANANDQPPWGHSLMFIKFLESILESLPEACLQAYVLVLQLASETLDTTFLPFQMTSMTISWGSIVSYVWAGRVGEVRGIRAEFPSTSLLSKLVTGIGTCCELTAKLVGLVMFGSSFTALYFALLSVEFLFKAVVFGYLGSIVETGINRIFPALTGGFFNCFVLSPGPWIGQVESTRGHRDPVAHRRQMWKVLLIFSPLYNLIALGLPVLPFLTPETKSLNSFPRVHGICRDGDTTMCFPLWLLILGVVCNFLAPVFLFMWVYEVCEPRHTRGLVRQMSASPRNAAFKQKHEANQLKTAENPLSPFSDKPRKHSTCSSSTSKSSEPNATKDPKTPTTAGTLQHNFNPHNWAPSTHSHPREFTNYPSPPPLNNKKKVVGARTPPVLPTNTTLRKPTAQRRSRSATPPTSKDKPIVINNNDKPPPLLIELKEPFASRQLSKKPVPGGKRSGLTIKTGPPLQQPKPGTDRRRDPMSAKSPGASHRRSTSQPPPASSFNVKA